MTLMQQIKADQLQARKDRNSEKSSLLTTLIGEAAMIGKNDGNRESTDAEVVGVIRKFLKNVQENKDIASKWSDQIAIARLDVESEILSVYLPTQMTAEQIKIALLGREKNKGLLMKHLKENFAGRYDGKLAAQIVDEAVKQ